MKIIQFPMKLFINIRCDNFAQNIQPLNTNGFVLFTNYFTFDSSAKCKFSNFLRPEWRDPLVIHCDLYTSKPVSYIWQRGLTLRNAKTIRFVSIRQDYILEIIHRTCFENVKHLTLTLVIITHPIYIMYIASVNSSRMLMLFTKMGL